MVSARFDPGGARAGAATDHREVGYREVGYRNGILTRTAKILIAAHGPQGPPR